MAGARIHQGQKPIAELYAHCWMTSSVDGAQRWVAGVSPLIAAALGWYLWLAEHPSGKNTVAVRIVQRGA